MRVSELTESALSASLKRGDFRIRVGPLIVQITSDVPNLAPDLGLLYSGFELAQPSAFCDFRVEIRRVGGMRRWVNPMSRFYLDGRTYFPALASYQAIAMLEWGLNWCVAAHCHQFLIAHAAVVERNGRAAMLPAPPGSGKSTLCAALVLRGWRLLSDELALYDTANGVVYGMARPVNLKNESIDVIQSFEPRAVFSRRVPNTSKGVVALMQPPLESVLRMHEGATPHWVVVPQFLAGADARVVAEPKSHAFMLLAGQSFNYDVLGEDGFLAMGDLIDRCDTYRFSYGRLDDAIAAFERLAQSEGGAWH